MKHNPPDKFVLDVAVRTLELMLDDREAGVPVRPLEACEKVAVREMAAKLKASKCKPQRPRTRFNPDEDELEKLLAKLDAMGPPYDPERHPQDTTDAARAKRRKTSIPRYRPRYLFGDQANAAAPPAPDAAPPTNVVPFPGSYRLPEAGEDRWRFDMADYLDRVLPSVCPASRFSFRRPPP